MKQVASLVKSEFIGAHFSQEHCVQQSQDKDKSFQISYLKPGFLVSGKVTKIYENGLEVSFLGGIIATCFADHLAQPMNEYKTGMKVVGRIISVDPMNKKVSLSLKQHIVEWRNSFESLKPFRVGSEFTDVKVDQVVYGGSYLVNLPNGTKAFLHKTQVEEQNEEDEKVTIEAVKVKEINYFDGMPIVTSKQSLLKSEALNFESVSVG